MYHTKSHVQQSYTSILTKFCQRDDRAFSEILMGVFAKFSPGVQSSDREQDSVKKIFIPIMMAIIDKPKALLDFIQKDHIHFTQEIEPLISLLIQQFDILDSCTYMYRQFFGTSSATTICTFGFRVFCCMKKLGEMCLTQRFPISDWPPPDSNCFRFLHNGLHLVKVKGKTEHFYSSVHGIQSYKPL